MLRYFGALRPMFLTVSAVGCFVGFAVGYVESGPLPWWAYVIATLVAVVGHGSANVINDLADADNGSDAVNTDRIFPFTGGSRFIQERTLARHQVKRLAFFTLFVAIAAGIVLLAALDAWVLGWLGVVGLGIGWIYSAEPFKLMSRGVWGELAIVAAWALIVIGSAMLGSHQLSPSAVLLAIAYGSMVANILYINQIPDIRADRSVGKMTLAVRMPEGELWKPYTTFLLVSFACVLVAVLLTATSWAVAIAFLSLPWAYLAIRVLKNAGSNRIDMTRAIQSTILAAHLFGLGLAIGVVV